MRERMPIAQPMPPLRRRRRRPAANSPSARSSSRMRRASRAPAPARDRRDGAKSVVVIAAAALASAPRRAGRRRPHRAMTARQNSPRAGASPAATGVREMHAATSAWRRQDAPPPSLSSTALRRDRSTSRGWRRVVPADSARASRCWGRNSGEADRSQIPPAPARSATASPQVRVVRNADTPARAAAIPAIRCRTRMARSPDCIPETCRNFAPVMSSSGRSWRHPRCRRSVRRN